MKKLILLILIVSCKKQTIKSEPIPEPVNAKTNLCWDLMTASNGFSVFVNGNLFSTNKKDSNIVFTVGDEVTLRNIPYNPSGPKLTIVTVKRNSGELYLLWDTTSTAYFVDRKFKVL